MSERDHRRRLIRLLIQEQDIGSQELLQQLLSSRGVETTQATLSRDLRDMGVIRQADPGGRRRYVLLDEGRYRDSGGPGLGHRRRLCGLSRRDDDNR